jgi:hypothetical protein
MHWIMQNSRNPVTSNKILIYFTNIHNYTLFKITGRGETTSSFLYDITFVSMSMKTEEEP